MRTAWRYRGAAHGLRQSIAYWVIELLPQRLWKQPWFGRPRELLVGMRWS